MAHFAPGRQAGRQVDQNQDQVGIDPRQVGGSGSGIQKEDQVWINPRTKEDQDRVGIDPRKEGGSG